MNQLSISLLGAVNGLLFGSTVEILRRIYTPFYRDQDIQREIAESANGIIGYRFSCIGDEYPVVISEIPLMCAFVFAVVALLVHTLWKNRLVNIVLLWQVIGIASATAAVTLHHAGASVCHHTYLLHPIWRWVLSLAIVVVVNLAYGAVMAASVVYYERWKKGEWLR